MLEVAVEACERIIVNQATLVTPALPDVNSYDDSLTNINTFGNEAEEVTSLIEFPGGASLLSAVLHIILLPMKASVHCEWSRDNIVYVKTFTCFAVISSWHFLMRALSSPLFAPMYRHGPRCTNIVTRKILASTSRCRSRDLFMPNLDCCR